MYCIFLSVFIYYKKEEKAPTKKEELCPNFFYGDPQF